MEILKSKTFILVAVVFVAAFFVGRLTAPEKIVSLSSLTSTASPVDCATKDETYTVRGDSLKGVIENGAKVKTTRNFYACKDAGQGDVVLYKYAGNPDPLVKIIKGVPGDTFALQKIGGGSTGSPQGWNILVNGKVVTNSEGKPYLIDDRAANLLSLYVHDYKGVIPANAYLILGNQVSGSLDSTRFGLVDKSDFVGKVVR